LGRAEGLLGDAPQQEDDVRLLYICNETGFFWTHRLAIAKAAVKCGWGVTLIANPNRRVAEIEEAGVTVVEVDLDPMGTNPASDLWLVFRLRAMMRTIRPNIVHTITVKPIAYGGALARWMNIPLVNSVCGMGQPSGLLRKAIRQVVKPALGHPVSTTIFQNTEDLAELGPLCRKTVLLEGAGVDLGAFRPTERRGRSAPVIMLPARMLEIKGVREFMASARRLRAQGLSAEFVLAGGTGSGSRWVPEHELAACEDVQWRGHRDDMSMVYQAADVVCLPSRGGEGVPKALLEAAACGLPIVTTDVAGCRAVVRHGENGYVVAPGDADALDSALRALIMSQTLRDKFGRRSRAIAEERFGIQPVVAAHLQIYREVLEHRASRAPTRQADGNDLVLYG
jgi:glycosyltransferase involved in cell wall biosynthesis